MSWRLHVCTRKGVIEASFNSKAGHCSQYGLLLCCIVINFGACVRIDWLKVSFRGCFSLGGGGGGCSFFACLFVCLFLAGGLALPSIGCHWNRPTEPPKNQNKQKQKQNKTKQNKNNGIKSITFTADMVAAIVSTLICHLFMLGRVVVYTDRFY